MGNGGSICLFPKGRDGTSTVGTYQQEERKEEEGEDGLKFLGGRDKGGKGKWCAFFSLLLSSFFFFSVSGKRGKKKSGFAPSFLENDCGGHGCGKDKEEEEKRRALFYFFRECPFS